MDIDSIRRNYGSSKLSREDLTDHPIELFQNWLGAAIQAKLVDPTAMSIATVSEAGQPSQRTVLLKHVDQEGFVFYTNLGSRKAREIKENARVSLLFSWLPLERQVKVCGTAQQVSKRQALSYFLSRPRDSQIAAWTSEQSQKVSSRALLLQQYADLKRKFAEGEVPLPSFWGGYRVVPHEIEFWQGGESRMHDRFQYVLQGNGEWVAERLAP